MFTGIVEEVGRVIHIDMQENAGKMEISAKKTLDGTNLGDSIAVNGVCLTVTSMTSNSFVADVMPETVSRSSLGQCKSGDFVNLERAMPANRRFGGHLVSGHIDGTGIIEESNNDGNAVRISIKTSEDITRLIVEKGSVAIDGISLTVVYVDKDRFILSVIPHTGAETTLLAKRPGEVVNIENDIIGKYIEKLLIYESSKKDIKKNEMTMDFLLENGF